MNQHWTGFILVLQTEINGTNHKLKFVDKAISVSVGRSHGQYTELIIRLLLQWSIHWLDFVDIILNCWDFHIERNDLKATVTPTDTHTQTGQSILQLSQQVYYYQCTTNVICTEATQIQGDYAYNVFFCFCVLSLCSLSLYLCLLV